MTEKAPKSSEKKVWQPDFDEIPEKNGVYEFRTLRGKILYVGKAKNLKKRVKQYFTGRTHGFTANMLMHAGDLKWHEMTTEREALLLEAALIRTHRPRYNILLKDDKSFTFVRIGAWPSPRIMTARARGLTKDGSLFFGPFTSADRARKLIKLAQKLFGLHSCRFSFENGKLKRQNQASPCMLCYLGRFSDEEMYKNGIFMAAKFLKGNIVAVEREMTEQINDLAEKMKFEAAKKLRDVLGVVLALRERQFVVDPDIADTDFVRAGAGDDEKAAMVIWQLRAGQIAEIFEVPIISSGEKNEKELLRFALPQFYASAGYAPPSVTSVVKIDGFGEVLGEIFADLGRMDIFVPKIGAKMQILERVGENVVRSLEKMETMEDAEEKIRKGLAEICEKMGIKGFDNGE